jgi:hypothetical protein
MSLSHFATPHRQHDDGLQGQMNTESEAVISFFSDVSKPSRSYPPEQGPYPPHDLQHPRDLQVGTHDLPPWSATSRPRLFPVTAPMSGVNQDEKGYTSYTQGALDQGLIVPRAEQMSGDGARSGYAERDDALLSDMEDGDWQSNENELGRNVRPMRWVDADSDYECRHRLQTVYDSGDGGDEGGDDF